MTLQGETMTLDERIEAGKLRMATVATVMQVQLSRLQIEALANAANHAFAPELFTSPPTMWLAPMEASEEMTYAAAEVMEGSHIPIIEDTFALAFIKARDAHLNREGK